jgi:hypothetical protein
MIGQGAIAIAVLSDKPLTAGYSMHCSKHCMHKMHKRCFVFGCFGTGVCVKTLTILRVGEVKLASQSS